MREKEKPGIRPVLDDGDALRCRVEELELENALMRELVEVVKRPKSQPEAPDEPGEDPR